MKHSFHLKHLGAVFLGLALPALALAQNAAPAKSTSAKTDAKPAAKTATTTKAAPAPKTAAKKADPASSRTQLKSAAVNVAAGIRAAEAALTPEELAIAERVYTGHMPCELGNSVTVTRDAGRPGYFDVQIRSVKYRMIPVATTTGAIRLEDQAAGAVWLQILNKSMLMNHKQGQRLADECVSAEQRVIAEGLKTNPAPNVLDPLPTASK